MVFIVKQPHKALLHTECISGATGFSRLGKALNIRFGQRGEMFQQQPLDEDVTAADFA